MSFMQAQSNMEFRQLMLKAENSEIDTKYFLEKASQDFKASNKPIFEAYIGVGNLLMAKHVASPFSKLSYFKEGKKHLEDAIAKSPNDLEMRFLRYTCQVEMPGILGYKKNISEDKSFILKHYKESKDVTLVSQIRQYFKI